MASRITVEALRVLLSSRGLPSRGRKADLLQRCRVNGVALAPPPEVAAPVPSPTSPLTPALAVPAALSGAIAERDGGAGAGDPRPVHVSPVQSAVAGGGSGAAAAAPPPAGPIGRAAAVAICFLLAHPQELLVLGAE